MKVKTVFKFKDSLEYLNYRRGKDGDSYRVLATRAGHIAYGYLADISRGNAFLNIETANKLAVAWELDFDEFTYWRALVEYENCTDPQLKKFFKQMMRTVKLSL